MNHGINKEDEQKILGLLKLLFPSAKIYLYGSRARGKFHNFSDIDIAIDEGHKIRPGRIGEAKSILESSNIVYKVDVVDLHSVSDTMKNSITNEGVVWRI